MLQELELEPEFDIEEGCRLLNRGGHQCKDTRVSLYVCVFSEKKDTINLTGYTHWFICQGVLSITRRFLPGRELRIPPSWVGRFPGRYSTYLPQENNHFPVVGEKYLLSIDH
jgi:hypothetical protein